MIVRVDFRVKHSQDDRIIVHCRLERSTDQVIKPINIEALSKWVGAIPEDVVRDMAEVAPMLEFLGEPRPKMFEFSNREPIDFLYN